MKYPKIYLVLDNCFAIKRWIKPSEWMELTKEIGFDYAQASTDNEIDPLFSPADYLNDWFQEVQRLEKITGVKVVNFYTGYQTYRTIGLAHHDERVRRKLIDGWFKPLILKISELKAAGVGFSYFAVPDEALQDPLKYKERTDLIFSQLSELTDFAFNNGKIQISFEQMYAPHQPPWTIDGTEFYLKETYKRNKKPIFVTLDVGHMVGQSKFIRPKKDEIAKSLKAENKNSGLPPIWLGSDSAYKKWNENSEKSLNQKEIEIAVDSINSEMDKYPYFFSEERDSDIYSWVEELACFSPIIHMQQTDGIHSSHAAFTPETNKSGIVTGDKLLKAIAKSYDSQIEPGMPPLAEDIYLSFEIFASNVEKKNDIIKKLKQTLEYWRKFVPKDGVTLDKLI
jgi:D-erythrulose 1-phosphate 3-epimerase